MNGFSYDSKFGQLMVKFSYACWLNLLWLICSLPVVTIGASTTALYSVTLSIADSAEKNVTLQFFRAFKANFKQATRLWLVMAVIGAVLGLDGYVVSHLRSAATGMPAVLWTLNLAFVICAAVVYMIVLMYIFPLTARFENNDVNMFKNAFLIGLHYLFCTIVVFGLHFVMFFLVVRIFAPLIMFGEGIVALLSSYLLLNVFYLCSPVDDEEEQEESDSTEGESK